MILAGNRRLVWAENRPASGYRPPPTRFRGRAWSRSMPVVLGARQPPAHESPLRDLRAMAATTLVAAGVSVRHGAVFTSVLGLLGGLATPILLSRNSNNPLGLFIYLAVLNTGFLWVARKRSWAFITGIALAGTSLMAFGWMATRLTERPCRGGQRSPRSARFKCGTRSRPQPTKDAATSHVLACRQGCARWPSRSLSPPIRRFVDQWPWVLGNWDPRVPPSPGGDAGLAFSAESAADHGELGGPLVGPSRGSTQTVVRPRMCRAPAPRSTTARPPLPDPQPATPSRPRCRRCGGAGLIVACGPGLFARPSPLVRRRPHPRHRHRDAGAPFPVGVEHSPVTSPPLALPAPPIVALPPTMVPQAALDGQ